MVTTKISSHISDVSNYSSIKFHVRISSTDGNIRDWLLLNCAFTISDVTQSILLQFFENFFSVSLSFFLVKLSKSQSLKLNISRTAWPILMILVLFCRILNGLSDEINLFWQCSSPLKTSEWRNLIIEWAQVILLMNRMYFFPVKVAWLGILFG